MELARQKERAIPTNWEGRFWLKHRTKKIQNKNDHKEENKYKNRTKRTEGEIHPNKLGKILIKTQNEENTEQRQKRTQTQRKQSSSDYKS